MQEQSDIYVSPPTYIVSSNEEEVEKAKLTQDDASDSWMPSATDSNPHLDIKFEKPVMITTVTTRGSRDSDGNEEFVVTYKLQYYSEDLGEWISVKDGEQEKLFDADDSAETPISIDLETPITTTVSTFSWLFLLYGIG